MKDIRLKICHMRRQHVRKSSHPDVLKVGDIESRSVSWVILRYGPLVKFRTQRSSIRVSIGPLAREPVATVRLYPIEIRPICNITARITHETDQDPMWPSFKTFFSLDFLTFYLNIWPFFRRISFMACQFPFSTLAILVLPCRQDAQGQIALPCNGVRVRQATEVRGLAIMFGSD